MPFFFRQSSLAWTVAAVVLATQPAAAVEPLAQAHAHNDYLHDRPLFDALDHGFTSVEADIFLVDGKLLVAHTERELDPEKSLEKLYLNPLRERIKASGGSVYGDGKPFHLLIDLKSSGEPTYAALHATLANYAEMLSRTKDGTHKSGAVSISISGDRPIAVIKNQSERYAGIDGRISDLDSNDPADVMPLISDNWFSHFRWLGTGEFKEADRQKLRDYVNRAHAKGRKVRFWAAPDNPSAWSELQAAGVDLINTDNLAGLEAFLREQPASSE